MAEETNLKSAKKRVKVDKKPLYDMIQKKAYELYEKRGREQGKNLDDWLEAEKIINRKKRK
ncbi:MAG: DUF2934 domain-containing protein [Deltaproteobacteria bacterium]|nr:DUF2934 domain-containing protein [Deltaproteobacteria bacterium]